MSRTELPTRLGFPTTETLKADMTVVGRIFSDRCADLEAAGRRLARLVDEPGAQEPTLGLGAALVHPEPINREALASIRDEKLRDAQRRLGALQDLLAGLIGSR